MRSYNRSATFLWPADFQDLSPRRFHHHSPIVFMIIHPPGSSLSSSLLPPWQSFGSIHYRVLSASLPSPPFGAKAYFVLEARKKSRWDGRRCIFSRSPIV